MIHVQRRPFLAAALFAILLSASASAATPTVHLWTGAVNSNWSVAGNWVGGAPTSGEPGGTAVFFSSNTTSVMNIPNLTIDLIQFGGTNNTISGSTVLNMNGNIQTTNIQNDQGSNVISCPLNLTNNAANLVVVTAGSLSLNGNISSDAGSNGLIFTNTANGTTTIGGAANNTYTGKTTVISGTLILNSGSSSAIPGELDIGQANGVANNAIVRLMQSVEIADTSNVIVNTSGLLDLNTFSETIASLTVSSGNVTVGSGALVVIGATSVQDGAIAIQTGALQLKSTLAMTGGSVTASTGTLSLGGDVTASASAVSGATISLGSGGMTLNAATRTFTVTPGLSQPELTITGVMSNGTVVSGLKKSGAGQLDLLNSQNNTFSGTSIIDKGLVRMNTTNGHIFNGPVIIGNNVDGVNAAILREFVQSNDIATVPMTINASGVFDLSGEIESVASLSGSGSVLLGTSGKFTLGSASNTSFSGTISGSGIVTKVGTGTQTFTGNNTYTGLTIASDGELDLNVASGFGVVSSLQIGDGVGAANSASVVLLQNGQIGTTSSVTVNSDGILNVNGKTLTSAALTVNGGTVSIGTGSYAPKGLLSMTGGSIPASSGSLIVSGDLSVTSGAAAGASIGAKMVLNSSPNILVTSGAVQPELVLSGAMSDGSNGAQGFFKSGTGTLGMIGAQTNTFSGTATVDKGVLTLNSSSGVLIPGTLIIGNAADLANSATVKELISDDLTLTTNITINASGLLDLNTHKDSIGMLAGTGNISENNSLSVGGNDTSSKFDGIISGTGGLTKAGMGTFTLSQNNTYANTTTVAAGTLIVNGSQPQSPVQVVTGGTLSGSGSVGATSVTVGTLAPNNGALATLSIMGNLTLASTSAVKLNVNSAAAGNFDAISVTGSVTLGGSLTLNFAPTFSAAGESVMTLINNDAADAITGTFAAVVEGQLFTPAMQQLKFSYIGGTGNDVTLTAQNIAPTITSGATVFPIPASVGQAVSFQVVANDLNQDTLTYTWNFGDSTTGSGAFTTHVYTVVGTYNVSVTADDGHGGSVASTATATVIAPIVGEGIDSDGDGFSDSFEAAAGTSPTDALDTPTGLPAATPTALPAVKLAVVLNFAKLNKDSISLSGSIAIPAGFVVLNQKVTVAVGGVVHGFTLTSKGAGTDAKNTFKLPIKTKKGVVLAQTAKYAMKLTLGNFATALAGDGLTNVTVKTSTHILPISLVFNKTVYQLLRPVTYKATAGKAGAAK